MSGRRSALISKVAQTDGHPKPGKAAQFAGMRHPDLRPDLPTDPERLPGNRARLADDGCSPGWPLPRNGSTDAAQGLWRKIVFISSELRGFAPSREPVISARPGLLPHHHEPLSSKPVWQGPHAGESRAQPGPERGRARPCDCPALLPMARKDR